MYPIICVNSTTANIGVLYVKKISNTTQIIAVKISKMNNLLPIPTDGAFDFMILPFY
jgi:hypothetical protein